MLGLVGEQIETSTGPQDDDFVCGAIVATRPRGNRIQIWVKEKDNVEKINFLGKRLINVLEITDHSGVSVDFSVGFLFFRAVFSFVEMLTTFTPYRLILVDPMERLGLSVSKDMPIHLHHEEPVVMRTRRS